LGNLIPQAFGVGVAGGGGVVAVLAHGQTLRRSGEDVVPAAHVIRGTHDGEGSRVVCIRGELVHGTARADTRSTNGIPHAVRRHGAGSLGEEGDLATGVAGIVILQLALRVGKAFGWAAGRALELADRRGRRPLAIGLTNTETRAVDVTAGRLAAANVAPTALRVRCAVRLLRHIVSVTALLVARAGRGVPTTNL